MASYSELFDSVFRVAKDAHDLNCEMIRSGIHDTNTLLQEMTGRPAAEAELEQAISDRLMTGFKNWNGGYDGWLKWCDTLYEPDAHYNIPFQGSQRRCTLAEYKAMMGQLFQHFTMELGDFDNMLIKGSWAAIRYTVKVKNLDTGKEILQHTMEFVNFRDTGDERGVRVVEGWALSDSALC